MKIVINSHRNNTIALNHLLDSMRVNPDFSSYEVLIMIGGYYGNTEYEIEKKDNITYIKCNHNSIDFTGLIALLELFSDTEERYIYLHDTCRVGDNFYCKIKALDPSITSAKIHTPWSMNIGVYTQGVINLSRDVLQSLKNKDEHASHSFKDIGTVHEDTVFNHDPTNSVLENYSGWSFTGPTDYYQTGTQRIVEYYPNLDVYKIKANWGAPGQVYQLKL